MSLLLGKLRNHRPTSDINRCGLQCDQREPGCGQCEKRQQKCPGYRNLVDLMFRDESSHVIRKATSKSRKKSLQSPGTAAPAPRRTVPTKLTWSPSQSNRGSSPTESERTCSTSAGPGTAISPLGSRSPPGCLTLDFGCSSSSRRESKVKIATEQDSASATAHLPAPTPCTFVPNVEDRGLHLFVARYVTVVSSIARKVHPSINFTCLLTYISYRTKPAAISNMTCKPEFLGKSTLASANLGSTVHSISGRLPSALHSGRTTQCLPALLRSAFKASHR